MFVFPYSTELWHRPWDLWCICLDLYHVPLQNCEDWDTFSACWCFFGVSMFLALLQPHVVDWAQNTNSLTKFHAPPNSDVDYRIFDTGTFLHELPCTAFTPHVCSAPVVIIMLSACIRLSISGGCSCCVHKFFVCYTPSNEVRGRGSILKVFDFLVCRGHVCPCVRILFTWPFVTRLGVVVHHHEPECHVKRLVCSFQGPSKGGWGCQCDPASSGISGLSIDSPFLSPLAFLPSPLALCVLSFFC